jgi:GNAT superfamily N-acetyltransferase
MARTPSISVDLCRARPSDLSRVIEIDDSAAALFSGAGMLLELAADHPFVLAEHARWKEAVARGDVWLANVAGAPVGFAVLAMLDGAAFLEQLSVDLPFMRRGIGRSLLRHALALSAASGSLWLTTYAHLPWNGPWYARFSFQPVAESACGPELRQRLRLERAALPHPHERVAMRASLALGSV